jgi:hypothetical protein
MRHDISGRFLSPAAANAGEANAGEPMQAEPMQAMWLPLWVSSRTNTTPMSFMVEQAPIIHADIVYQIEPRV